ncbi:hypothetical protein [Curtanaerobium respiraculi]|uniref:hypothetical protein n=1 Tax=Curtanaerobium respiraculi TaxID=2949669 RepID=UPI0024B3BD51|nr:hypothetical protein [Curtanaerobium respiraculi]
MVVDDAKQEVLDAIQSRFPLVHDPYGQLAAELGLDRDEVKRAVVDLYADASIRRTGGSFDSRRLGYTSTLCALAVPGGPERVQAAADVCNRYTGITHNYGRENRYNLWFTLITPSPEVRARILAEIKRDSGCEDLLDMPALRIFKINGDFGRQQRALSGKADSIDSTLRREDKEVEAVPFDSGNPFDVALVRWAQDDMARSSEGEVLDFPFERGARQISAETREDATEEQVLLRLRQLRAARALRRFGAMVRHQVIGFGFNCMTAWDIPDEHVERAGMLLKEKVFVSHCYARPRQGLWSANIYAMIHAKTVEQESRQIAELEEALNEAGVPFNERFVLNTTHEYKKCSMRYFVGERTYGN